MHLIPGGRDLLYAPLYKKNRILSRPDSLSSIFRKLRLHRNLTKKALAGKFGVSEEYVSAIESGSKFPSLNICLKCGDEFGANSSWVKTKWAKEAIERFSNKLMKRLGLND